MRRRIALMALLAAAGTAGAQATIDQGMTKDQVVARLGRPSSEHTSGTVTYLYYPNGQERKYGMNDLVTIENGKVVDAIFRSSSRKYSGKSSSPAAISAEDAIARGNGGHRPAPPKTAPAKAAPAKAAPPKTAPPKVAPVKAAPAKTTPPAPTKKP